MATETEIKVEVTPEELEALRSRLRGESSQGSARQEEKNTLYDQGDRLRSRGCTLRLRSYGGRSILTFKGPVDPDSPFKKRAEFETEVEREAMRAILDSLGFRPSFHYDKYRETRHWKLGGGEVEVCFDETPVGCFVEIEGAPDLLAKAAEELGWETNRFIKRSYVEIYQTRQARESAKQEG